MGNKLNTIGEGGLQFYGKITASVSHEIKNVLAIINENAGLLEDFTVMADRGMPIDPAKLKLMAEAVKKQVRRADDILKNMNRFAHSTDEVFTEVDLTQIIELFAALTERFASLRGVKLDLQLSPGAIMITTAPFCLINLLWLCLDFCMTVGAGNNRMELGVEEAENYILVRFRLLTDLAAELLRSFPSDDEENLLKLLSAELAIEAGSDEVTLRLPRAWQ